MVAAAGVGDGKGVGGGSGLSAEVEVEKVETSQHVDHLDDGSSSFRQEVDP